MQAIVDTNVWLTALRGLRPGGASQTVVENILSGRWRGILSTATFLEISDVLMRPEFGLPLDLVEAFLGDVGDTCYWASPYPAPATQRIILRDAGDQKWLDLLHSTHANALITYNTADFAPAIRAGYPILRPQDAVARWPLVR